MLEIDELAVSYGAIQAVRGISFRVAAGETVALIGPNGAGKSTTLLAIAGVLKPASGSVRFQGERIDHLPPERVVRRGLALVPEGRRILTRMTVEENLRLAASPAKSRPYQAREDRVIDLFPVLGRFRNKLAGLLSGGEQQQLAIGRALMSDPQLLLLDEPSLGLAPTLRDLVFERVDALKASGMTVLLVEQDAKRALSVADRGCVLQQGAIVFESDAEELFQATERIEHAYLGEGGGEAVLP
jgi:branched-chain amino acid transport system ATP-binding protein